MDPDAVVLKLEDELLADYRHNYMGAELHQYFHPLIALYVQTTLDPTATAYPVEDILTQIRALLSSDITLHVSFDRLSYLLNTMINTILLMITSDAKRCAFLLAANAMYRAMNQHNSNLRYLDRKDYQVQVWNASYIARDTLDYGKDNDACFNSLLEKLESLSFDSSYLYLYDDPVLQLADGSWKIPDELILQAYDNDMRSVVLQNQRIRSVDIFDNPYTPKNRRCTFIVNPIFTNEQQHGLFVCEIAITKFHHIYSADLQLGTALKFLNLIKEQMSTHTQLMLSLQEIHNKNNQLNHLSVSDELTGLYNRRGFMELATKLITSAANAGKKAIICYADMDNLKLVNDKFGHKNGDYALKSIANTLRASFQPDDILGRIGGDEFIAFAFVTSDTYIEQLHRNLAANSDQVNQTSGKPYYIDISIGISEFICRPDVSIEDVMSEADTALYVNKKYKRISVLKN